MSKPKLVIVKQPLQPPPAPRLYPLEEEARLDAQTQLSTALCGLKLRDFLNLPDTAAHLLSRWEIEAIDGKIHPCQLETEHWRELLHWISGGSDATT